jgi:hypothetical protein
VFRRPVVRICADRRPSLSVIAVTFLLEISVNTDAFGAADLTGIVKDEAWAKILGKALFWDSVANDNSTCGACHSNAGADRQIPSQAHDGFSVRQAKDLGPDVRPQGEQNLGMSFARKLLERRPLDGRSLDPDDRLFGTAGPYGNLISPTGRGLDRTYFWLIRQAFDDTLWNASRADAGTSDGERVSLPAGSTQLEQNFPLFWRISIMLYEATLPTTLDAFHSCMLDGQAHPSTCYGETIPRLHETQHTEEST